MLAELESGGWIAWDWIRYGGDPRPEQPPAAVFDAQSTQHTAVIRTLRGGEPRPAGGAAELSSFCKFRKDLVPYWAPRAPQARTLETKKTPPLRGFFA